MAKYQEFPLDNLTNSKGSNELIKNLATLIERDSSSKSKTPKYILRHIKTVPSQQSEIKSHCFHSVF